MDTARLRTFLAIAEQGHLTRAAEQVHLTQPAVSAQLRGLEEELDQQLFDRTPKGMVLTEAGTTFRRYAIEALETLAAGRRALDALSGVQAGSLAIGGGATATTYLLPKHLGAFHDQYPGVQLFVREQGSTAVARGVLEGALDLGIVTLPLSGLGSRNEGRLMVEPLVEDELRLLLPPGHRLDKRKSFAWDELDGEPLILFEAGTAVRTLLDRRIDQAQIEVEIVMELRSIESIKQMVAEGIGAAFVSDLALGEDRQGLWCRDGRVRRQLAVATLRDRTSTAATRAFLQLLRGPG